MNRPQLTLSSIWLILPTVLVLLVVWTSNEFPLDFWLHVNSGRWMCETGHLISTDTFTHTIAGQTVLNQPWLTQLAMYQLFRAGGYELNQFVAGLCYAAAFGLITALTYRRTNNARVTTAVMLVALIVGITNLAVRPQAISVLLFALELYILWTFPTRWFAPLSVTVIEFVWSNVHGAFPLGIVLPGVFLVARLVESAFSNTWRNVRRDPVVRAYFLCCALATAMMFINPQGVLAIRYVTGVTSRATQRQIEEWLPTSVGTDAGTAFLASVVLALVILGASRRAPSLAEWFLLVPFLVLAAKSQRMVIWWALVLPPILGPQLGHLFSGWRTRLQSISRRAARLSGMGDLPHQAASTDVETAGHGVAEARRHAGAITTPSALMNWILISSFACVLVASTPWTRRFNLLLPAEKRATVPADEPWGAVAFLSEAGYEGRMYQPMEWGSYVSWRLDPRVKVFVDSRVDFFPDSVWNDYVAIGKRPDQALDTLQKYGIGVVLWDHRLPSSLPHVLDASPTWRRVYGDHNSVVFVHQAAMARAAKHLAGH